MEFHPMTVHFTIGLFFTGLLFELAGWLFHRDGLRIAAWWNLLAASLAALASILTGVAAEGSHPHTEAIHDLMTIHEQRAWWFLATLVLFLATRAFLAGGAPFRVRRTARWILLSVVLLLAAAGILFSGARLGGEMVYGHGMAVVPMMGMMGEAHEHGDHDHDMGEAHDHDHDMGADHDHDGHSH